MTLETILLCDTYSFWIGLASSMAGSILVVFLLFFFFRPRFKVNKEIAIDKQGKLGFCFKTKSLFPCINIHVTVNKVKEHANADESEASMNLEYDNEALMKGCFGKENESELGVYTKDPIDKIPQHIRIVISAQHAVSGIFAATTHNFVASDAKGGRFEKGIFVPNGSSYAQEYIRMHLKKQRITFWICIGIIVPLTILYAICISASVVNIALCFIILFSFTSICLILWHIYVLARADAFSSKMFHKFNLLMLALGNKKNGSGEVEDADIEEVVDNPKTKK